MKVLNTDPSTQAPPGVDPEILKKFLETPVPAATDTPVGNIEFDMEALVQQGTLERTVEPIKGLKVTMHVLNHKERKEVSKAFVPKKDATSISLFEDQKVPTLKASISKMGTKDYTTPEQKMSLGNQLEVAPDILVDILYLEYQKLVNDQLEVMEQGVKKNS